MLVWAVLILGARGGSVPEVSGHAIVVTLDWIALATAFGALAAFPLSARSALESDGPPRYQRKRAGSSVDAAEPRIPGASAGVSERR
jgi:hypothetical protein